MNAADTLAPVAIGVLMVLGLMLLSAQLVGSLLRRRRQRNDQLGEALAELARIRTRPTDPPLR